MQLYVSIYTILAIQAGQSLVFHMYRSKRALWPSCREVLSFELRYWRSEAQKEEMQDILASLKPTRGKLVRYFRQAFCNKK